MPKTFIGNLIVDDNPDAIREGKELMINSLTRGIGLCLMPHLPISFELLDDGFEFTKTKLNEPVAGVFNPIMLSMKAVFLCDFGERQESHVTG